jgi:hypothetical protein
MADHPFSYPLPQPLERLHVHDGLMMNAERWRIAHRYHRHRQNVHYQALYQPGIVCGLGVKVIPPPPNSSLRYRAADQQQGESRWLEIQPGIAIDVEGNPIVVDAKTDRTYRIAIDPPTTGNCTVYLVVSYVDPDALEHQPHKLTVPELFRFDQKTTPPTEREVELCRIELAPGGIFLKLPPDIFAPSINEINLLHRVQAQARSQTYVRLGAIAPRPEAHAKAGENCEYLVRSLSALYPVFQGNTDRFVNLVDRVQCNACDLLFAQAETLFNLSSNPEAIETLKQYFNTGGMLLIESPADPAIDQQTWQLIKTLRSTHLPAQLPRMIPWSDLERDAPLPAHHPLRTEPFVFTTLPTFGEPMQVAAGAGVIWVRGALSAAWGIRGAFPRSEMRTAQELGINVLHFAWQRRHLTALMHWSDQ